MYKRQPFLYVENGDPVSLSHAEGKIVLINGGANAENYEKLEKAGAVGFLILTGTPLDKDEDRLPDYRTPVSYTPLDVFKRQFAQAPHPVHFFLLIM